MCRAQRLCNALEHSVGVAERLIVPEAKHAVAETFEECGTPRVVVGTRRMLTAVKLHDQPLLPAAEVDDVGADRHLARESHAEETTVAQSRPQPALRVRRSTAQPAGVVAR